MTKKKITTKKLLQAAILAAIYGTLTVALAPISYGPMQIRVSEALTVLPALTPAGIPGLFIGCLVANILGPYGLVDIVCGSLATLISAVITYKVKNKPWLVPMAPVVVNALVIGAMLHYAYGVPNLILTMSWVALGQIIACYGLGYPLLKILKKYSKTFEQ